MIVKAKDQVNDALDVLFSKESSLNKVVDLKSAFSATKINSEDQQKEKLKLGILRINGNNLPLKKVISLNDTNFKTFKQNISVFAH